VGDVGRVRESVGGNNVTHLTKEANFDKKGENFKHANACIYRILTAKNAFTPNKA